MKFRAPDGIGQDYKTIGVVGVAPWSTIDLLNILYSQIDAPKDWHFPRVICDINTRIPSRGRHFELGEEDFSPYIKSNINSLKGQGAEIAIVACNTAHIYYDKWSDVEGIEVLNIIDECVKEVKLLGARKVAFFAGLALRNQGLYQEKIRQAGLDLIELDNNEAELVYQIILTIKKNNSFNKDQKLALEQVFIRLQKYNVDTLILGCTELGCVKIQADNFFENVVDSNLALIKSVIKKAII